MSNTATIANALSPNQVWAGLFGDPFFTVFPPVSGLFTCNLISGFTMTTHAYCVVVAGTKRRALR